MVTSRLLVVSCLLAAAAVNAGPLTYHLTDPAKKYVIDVQFAQPPTQTFDGAPALITLRKRAGGQVVQRIESAEAFALFKPGRKASEFDRNLAYADQNLLLFGDFNFDGQQDLAVRNGNNAGYGGPSYDIYLFDPQSPTLVLSTSFSALTRDENLGMFGIDPVTKSLHTQSKSGCCWRQSATWQIQDNLPVKVAEKTEVVQKPSQASPFMPYGYVDVTNRELKSGQWTERRRLEGPVGEAPVMLRGTLDDKIPVELWWQRQGDVYVGEVRYGKTGSGQPIRLVGNTYEEGGIVLRELDDDGQMIGNWFVEGTPNEQGSQTGTWINGSRQLSINVRPTAFKVAAQKLERVADSQRAGRYLVSNVQDRRVGELTLKVVPAIDNGPEMADINLSIFQLKDPPVEVHHQYPLLAGNLVIALDPEGDPLFRLQLLNGAAEVTGFGEYQKYSAAYVKQP